MSFEDAFDPLDHHGGAVDRGALGQLCLDEEGALIFLRQEAGGDDLEQERVERDHPGNDDEAEYGDPHQPGDDRGIAVARPVDGTQHVADRATLRPVMVAQKHRAQGRCQAQRVDRRDHHRDGDRHRELLVELARDARE